MNYRTLWYLSFIILVSCASMEAQPKASSCITTKIANFREQPLANPPISVYEYSYKGKLVYYISAPCCDQFTSLYDKDCNLICHPSGGITGNGDGQCQDFIKERSGERLIWKDNRQPQ